MGNGLAKRLVDRFMLAGIRPPLPTQLSLHRPAPHTVDLTGKRVLVTGASSGIGENAAERFGRAGAVVVGVARRKDRLDALVHRITAAGGTGYAMPCDLRDLTAIDRLVTEAEDLLGGIDVLVNNAGKSIRRPLEESLDRWHDAERTMTLNYFAPLRLIRGFAPGMLERGDGHVINVASFGILAEGASLFGVYHASKAALAAVSRVIETEWKDRGVVSTTLYLPNVDTPMIAPVKDIIDTPLLSTHEAAGWIITAARRRPLRIAPKIGLTARALDTLNPAWANALMEGLG